MLTVAEEVGASSAWAGAATANARNSEAAGARTGTGVMMRLLIAFTRDGKLGEKHDPAQGMFIDIMGQDLRPRSQQLLAYSSIVDAWPTRPALLEKRRYPSEIAQHLTKN